MSQARDYFVHESAYVDEPCEIGRGTKIWHFCHVMKGAKVGARCVLGQNVLVASGAVICHNDAAPSSVAVHLAGAVEDDTLLGPS